MKVASIFLLYFLHSLGGTAQERLIGTIIDWDALKIINVVHQDSLSVLDLVYRITERGSDPFTMIGEQFECHTHEDEENRVQILCNSTDEITIVIDSINESIESVLINDEKYILQVCDIVDIRLGSNFDNVRGAMIRMLPDHTFTEINDMKRGRILTFPFSVFLNNERSYFDEYLTIFTDYGSDSISRVRVWSN